MTRTINLGADATDAEYQIRDSSSTGGDFVIEHLPSGATFTYDQSTDTWSLGSLDVNDLTSDTPLTIQDGNTTLLEITGSGPVAVKNTELLLQDGSASDPALAFDNDTDTGIYLSANNALTITTAGGKQFTAFGGSSVGLEGNNLIEVGGTTDASNGLIRTASDVRALAIRNNDDDGNHSIGDSAAGGGNRGILVNTSDRADEQVNLSAPKTSNTTSLSYSSTAALALDEGNDDADLYVKESDDTTGIVNLGSYSSRLNKGEIETFQPDVDILEVTPQLFTRGWGTAGGNGDRRAGFVAEDFIDAGAEWAVIYDEPENVVWEDNIDDDYMAEYANDGEVPKDINDRAILGYHHEELRRLRDRVAELEQQVGS